MTDVSVLDYFNSSLPANTTNNNSKVAAGAAYNNKIPHQSSTAFNDSVNGFTVPAYMINDPVQYYNYQKKEELLNS